MAIVDSAKNAYFSTSSNCSRLCTPTGAITSLAGVSHQSWQTLYKAAIQPSGSVNVGWVNAFASPQDNLIWCVRQNKLEALAVITKSHLKQGRIFPLLHSWKNDMSLNGIPLIATSDPINAWHNLLNVIDVNGLNAIRFDGVPTQGPLFDSLQQAAKQLGFTYRLYNHHQRAALNTANSTFTQWYQENFSRKRRKEYNRLKNRLGELGTLAFQSFAQGDDTKKWVDEFLALEAAGWKGRSGTAMAKGKDHGISLHKAVQELAANDNLKFWKLTLDGKPVAIMFAGRDGNQVWLGKIAYDETHAKYSPGVQLILAVTEDLFADSRVKMVDSSAIPDHPMINNIWRDRQSFADILISNPKANGMKFALIAYEETVHRSLRKLVKTAYLKIKDRMKRT